MPIDLYTLYLYSYIKEYINVKGRDIIKLKAFSDSSKIRFIDDFLGEEIIANSPMEFFQYLERRQCFKVQLGDKYNKGVTLLLSCRYSQEFWCRDEKREEDGELVFVKASEILWVTKYRELTDGEILNIRTDLKKNHYR